MKRALFLVMLIVVLPHPSSAEDKYVVSKILDGNTLQLTNGEVVRLIGVDTPEFKDDERNKRNAERLGIDLEHYESYAVKSKEFLESRFENVKGVQLEFDAINKKNNHRDKYGRLLAYAWVELFPWSHAKEFDWAEICYVFDYDRINPQGYQGAFVDINKTLISCGYSLAYTKLPFKYVDKFVELESEAREKQRGIWSMEASCESNSDCEKYLNRCSVNKGTVFCQRPYSEQGEHLLGVCRVNCDQ